MVRRGAHSAGRISSREAARFGGVPRALSSGSGGDRTLLSLASVMLCVMSAVVLKANAHHDLADRRRLIAARIEVAQIGHPLAVSSKPASDQASKLRKAAAATVVHTPTATAAAPVTATAAAPAVTPTAATPVPPDPIVAYRGLGAWVDWFDYGHPWTPDPASVVDQLAQRGVRTLFLQTGLWSQGPDILYPGGVDSFLDHAHARGIRVVGWYLPGFADIDHDIRASLAVLAYTSPSGQHFDGFAPDIEDLSAIQQAGRHTATVSLPRSRACPKGCTNTVVVDASPVDVLARFNAGITDYSRRLRQSVPAGTTLGAIVLDAEAVNREASYWVGFPWPEIAARYDVVLPMAYWSITKPAACPAVDATSYIRDVVTLTESFMGSPRPIHPIGGVADCLKAQDVNTYVDATKASGSIGGSLYDFPTIQANPEKDAFWSALARLNG
ncbi:MAG: hypothetical protein QOG36_526 [Actinomycetota bacterium]|nr:hypothetical protein [Actinomycetota bacterium]